eukprot:2966691-Rhodomonas_salina.3
MSLDQTNRQTDMDRASRGASPELLVCQEKLRSNGWQFDLADTDHVNLLTWRAVHPAVAALRCSDQNNGGVSEPLKRRREFRQVHTLVSFSAQIHHRVHGQGCGFGIIISSAGERLQPEA